MGRIPPVGALAPFGLGHLQEDDIVLAGQWCLKQPKAKAHRTVRRRDAPAPQPSIISLARRAAVHAAVVHHAKQTTMRCPLGTHQDRAVSRMSSHTRTARPQVARAQLLSMDSQGKRAAGRADRAHRVLRTSTHDHSLTLINIQRCRTCSPLTLLQARASSCLLTCQMTLI